MHNAIDNKGQKTKKRTHLKDVFLSRAENEARTRDPNLGKVVLYQLSYFRNFTIYIEGEEEETRTPTPRGTTTSK